MLQPHPHEGWQQPLPTMYDLPSEDPEEPGLPDEFHDYQPDLLSATLRSPHYSPANCFTASDLNLYYDPRHTRWYKRPDWFLVLGVAQFAQQQNLRLSYVIWQEGISPFLVIELLSPGTEREDMGQTLREVNQPPTKWQVYEQILRVPYYLLYDRYDNEFRGFRLEGTRYRELDLSEKRLWFEELELGLGTWQGTYDGVEGLWLRWYDAASNWIPTPEERAELAQQRAEQQEQRAEQERQRAEQERQRAEQAEVTLEQERQRQQAIRDRLLAMGIDPDTLT